MLKIFSNRKCLKEWCLYTITYSSVNLSLILNIAVRMQVLLFIWVWEAQRNVVWPPQIKHGMSSMPRLIAVAIGRDKGSQILIHVTAKQSTPFLATSASLPLPSRSLSPCLCMWVVYIFVELLACKLQY
ncbi:Hypothetical predicted protein [Olea europaea subsp. europaea]|uniref:Uncharacterized protein n=1 Tax=Olea europaea subsp. europaea TaxID=158383 RepID=A0A8S0S7K4_OLEEU|nr:Hypothetical predicted protein [Olea europaea subsp. europaea]